MAKTSTPYTVPAAPAGTETVIRSRVLGDRPDNVVELKRVAVGDAGTYSPHAPLQFFSAFDAAGNHLGTWSPGYEAIGWNLIPSSERSLGTTYGTAPETLLLIRGQALSGYAEYAEARREWAAILAGKTVTTLPCE
jgi:hypothetical protein